MPPAPDRMELAFLDDIVAHPDDPSLWLILADWLDEQEDPRGELVRLTWSLQYEPARRGFKKRQTRVQELLATGVRPVRPRRSWGAHDFVWIAPGTFVMGSPEDEQSRQANEAQHPVTLTRGFWLGAFPVTQGQWRAVLDANPSSFSRDGEDAAQVETLSDADLDRLPVENTSWNLATEFCAGLSQHLRRRVYLPSEAQWEYACRAGTTSPFPFGRTLNGAQANADGGVPYATKKRGPYLERTSPVGAYPPNPWGLYDMIGNVLEWCQDDLRPDYEVLPAVDPLHPPGHGHRVARGGCWYSNCLGCRSALRLSYAPEHATKYFGLRVCIE